MKRAYMKYTKEALLYLGQLIKLERKKRKLSELDFAERAGIARSTLQKIEKGDPSVEIGVVFDVAHIGGVKLFDIETSFSTMTSAANEKLSLLPKRIRQNRKKVRDDF